MLQIHIIGSFTNRHIAGPTVSHLFQWSFMRILALSTGQSVDSVAARAQRGEVAPHWPVDEERKLRHIHRFVQSYLIVDISRKFLVAQSPWKCGVYPDNTGRWSARGN